METQSRHEIGILHHIYPQCHIAYAELYNTREDVNSQQRVRRGERREIKARKVGFGPQERTSDFNDLVASWKVEFKTSNTWIKRYRHFGKRSDCGR